MSESNMKQSLIAAIKFSKVENYKFDASSPNIHIGDSVVVETARGLQIGMVTGLEEQSELINKGIF